MRRGLSLTELQQKFDAVCVVDTTRWDEPGTHFEVWTADQHRFVDGKCEWCGTEEDAP